MTAEGDKKISVKICGITTLEDALLATELGCDALGINFVSSSKRRVTPETVKSIIRHLPEEMMMVGIFQDLESEKLIRLIEETGLMQHRCMEVNLSLIVSLLPRECLQLLKR